MMGLGWRYERGKMAPQHVLGLFPEAMAAGQAFELANARTIKGVGSLLLLLC
jgi:hypothetical protein